MTTVTTRPLSLDEWEAFTAARPETERWELVRGVPEMAPSEHAANLDIAAELGYLLRGILGRDRWCYLQGADLALHDDPPPTVRRPDLTVARSHATHHRFVHACDAVFVCEIVSPSNRSTDLLTKRREYATAGIPAYLVIDRHAPVGERLTLLTDPDGGDYRTAVTADDVTLTIDGTDVALSAADLLR
ncbi:MAG: Uma2 family endonuclease [Dermatophilus congolensis]|nr:Uma2 family endonuclease [Dermatophilus congolensis]